MKLQLSRTLRWQTLAAGKLTVTAGELWLTRDHMAEDWVLRPGETLAVRAGELLTLGPLHEGRAVVALSLPETQASAGPLPSGLSTLSEGGSGTPLPGTPFSQAGLRAALLARLAGLARGLAGGLLALARRAEATACRAQGSICAGESMASAGVLK